MNNYNPFSAMSFNPAASSIPSFNSPYPAMGYGSNIQPTSGFGLGPNTLSNNMFGITPNTDTDGGIWGNLGNVFDKHGTNIMRGVGLLANIYGGFQQNRLARESLNMQRDFAERNYAAQRSMTNSRLEDRQRTRVASSNGQTPVDQYMAQYGIK